MLIRKKKSQSLLLCLFGVLILVCGSACDRQSSTQVQSNDSIKIGEVTPQTGPDAAAGVSVHRGIELFVQQVNQSGGIRGKKIELVTLDDQGKPEQAALAATKLITQTKVLAIVGTLSSSGTIAMAPIAQSYKIPLVTPTATQPKITEMGNYIFRVCFTDPFQGEVLAKFAYDQLHLKKVAILHDIKSDYSAGLSDLFSSTFKKLGGEIVSRESYRDPKTRACHQSEIVYTWTRTC